MKRLAGYLSSAVLAVAAGRAADFVIVSDGRPQASIVIDAHPTIAARLGAAELQYHVWKISGAVLPISNQASASGNKILIGESDATRRAGLRGNDFPPQEYLIRTTPAEMILLGRDWAGPTAQRREVGNDTNFCRLEDTRLKIDYAGAVGGKIPGAATEIELPGPYDDQGTCQAVYEFLERFCGVRWYGPGEREMVFPHVDRLAVPAGELRRSPAMAYRMGTPTTDWPMMKAQWGDPSAAEVALYLRRLRLGGEKWAANHSFQSYRERFWEKSATHPERFVARHPEYFARGADGQSSTAQLCYTDPALIAQVVADARDYFDGRGLQGEQVALGDFFAVVPLDNNAWCRCERCQAQLARDRENARGEHFNSGRATHYWFTFVNAVAREVARTHPGKFIATLAYHDYAFHPTAFAVEANVAVAPCLQVRNYWAPRIRANEDDFYRAWTGPRDRPVHVWNYYCFPEEAAFLSGKWRCFPGFSAHVLAGEIKRYAADGVRGVFLCGLGEQVDFYLTQKLYDDPNRDVDALLHEYFVGYFGAAGRPMERFYRRIEETFSDPKSYPPEMIGREVQLHQDETIAWSMLGTSERMTELAALMREAESLASTPDERWRVERWKVGIWNPMVEGRQRYVQRVAQSGTAFPTATRSK